MGHTDTLAARPQTEVLIGSEAVSSKLDPADLTSPGRTLRFPGAEPLPREEGETSPCPSSYLSSLIWKGCRRQEGPVGPGLTQASPH